MTIVGVAEAGFDGTTLGSRARIFVPITSLEAAQNQLNVVYHPIIDTVEVPLQSGIPDQMLARFKAKVVTTIGDRASGWQSRSRSSGGCVEASRCEASGNESSGLD